MALHRAGQLDAAAEAYRGILRKNPREPDTLHLLGVALGQKGDAQGGLAFIEKALKVRDNFPDAHRNAALIAYQARDLARAEHHTRKELSYRPTVTAHRTLGELLGAQGRHGEALDAFRAAHTCDPADTEACVAYARALRMTRDLRTLSAVAEEGLKRAPDHPTLRLLAGEAAFGLGRLQDGWRAYRARFRSHENKVLGRTYPLPAWQGEDLTDRGILVWAEQGPGDEAMYANMYADIVAAARRCVLHCTPRLAPLMRRSFPDAEVIDHDPPPDLLAALDVQSPAASLGEWLRPTLQSFPARPGYLRADPDLRDTLRRKYLGAAGPRLLVGIAWRSANVENAADKSVSVLDWGPILHVPGVTFVNLQYGDCAQELSAAAAGFGVPIVQDADIDPLRDLDAYAAQVAAMDLVISSSNTAAHVAGALGVPSLCMLPASLGHGRRWYWLAESGRCPWYPATRLFVQEAPGDWLGVIRDVGLALLDRAAETGAAPAPYLRSVGKAFAGMGRTEDAEALYRHMAESPGLAAEAFFLIAESRKAASDAEGALAHYDRAIAADPAFWHAHNGKGLLFAALNRFDEAIAAYKQGLAANAASFELHSNLGQALGRLGRAAEAIPHYERAIACVPPDNAFAVNALALNHAGALHDTGESARALEVLGDLIARAPDHVDAHYNRAQILLALGRYEDGWRELAWRLKHAAATNLRDGLFAHLKPWDGDSLAGKKVLIWTEQGIGDEILTATMIPDALAAAKHVIILCEPRLVPLFRRSFPRAHVEVRTDPLPKCARDPAIDCQMSMAELGLAFRRDLAAFPKQSHVLAPDAARARALRARYAAYRPGDRIVGLSWASPMNLQMGWLKSNRLEAWHPILRTPGVTFVSLQYGDPREDIARVRAALGIEIVHDAAIDALKDMDGFAAQVAAMDLVISISNTAVHTAGALGIPAWVLLAEGRGRLWYWLKDREDSPWYSSVRLLRQTRAEGWTGSIERCARDLRAWAQDREKNGAP